MLLKATFTPRLVEARHRAVHFWKPTVFAGCRSDWRKHVLNFDAYKYFLTAAEELNFTQAAKKLYITQQALSRQIDKLEKTYNVRLFNREPPMSLTAAGKCLYRHIYKLMDDWTTNTRCAMSWMISPIWPRISSPWVPPIFAAASCCPVCWELSAASIRTFKF